MKYFCARLIINKSFLVNFDKHYMSWTLSRQERSNIRMLQKFWKAMYKFFFCILWVNSWKILSIPFFGEMDQPSLILVRTQNTYNSDLKFILKAKIG